MFCYVYLWNRIHRKAFFWSVFEVMRRKLNKEPTNMCKEYLTKNLNKYFTLYLQQQKNGGP